MTTAQAVIGHTAREIRMTAAEWAEIFEAGKLGIKSAATQPAVALAQALEAMAEKCKEISARKIAAKKASTSG